MVRNPGDLLSLGTPAATQILLEISAFSAATAFCAKLGPVPLSGHEIALNCAAFTYMVPLGISSAAAVRVGYQLGRGNPAKAHLAGWSAILLGAGFMAFMGLIFVTLPQSIARIFTPDPTVVQVGAKLLLVAAAFQLFDGLQTVATGALRGSGDTRSPMFANLIAYWFIGLPAGTGCEYRVSPSHAQAPRLLSVLKVITRREGGGRMSKSRSDFQGAVDAFSASMATGYWTLILALEVQQRRV